MKVKMSVPMMIITLIILVAIAAGLHYLGVGKQGDVNKSDTDISKEIKKETSPYSEKEPIAQIRLITPKGGESYKVGDNIKIAWETTDWKEDYVQIFIQEQCSDGTLVCAGELYYKVIDQVPNNGSFVWSIPEEANQSDHYVIGVGISGMFEHIASNDGYITILRPSSEK